MKTRIVWEIWKGFKRQGRGDQAICERNYCGDTLMPLVCPYVNRRCGLEERKRPRHTRDRKGSQRIALGHRYTFSSESAQHLATVSSRVASSRCSSVRGSPRDNKSCTPTLTESPSVTHHQSQRTNSTSTSGLGGRISGRIMARAAGRPMAEPSAPIVSTRLRNNPPKRNTTKKTKTQPHDIQ